jgi:probable rRNA maturation factor
LPYRSRAELTCGFAAAGRSPKETFSSAERQSLSAHQAAEPRDMIQILNRQRRHKVHATDWREFAEHALQAIGAEDRDATVVFVSDAAIRKLNRQFRGKDYATDVLSFPSHSESFETDAEANLGEIVISLDRAQTQAKENGLNGVNEVQQLMLHGLLHLCGYDHETDKGEMNRLELKIRKKLGI